MIPEQAAVGASILVVSGVWVWLFMPRPEHCAVCGERSVNGQCVQHQCQDDWSPGQ